MNTNTRIKILRGLVIALVLAIPLSILYWLYTHAFIQIVVSDPSTNQEITYTIADQNSDKTKEIKTKDHAIKKLVRKGSYEVTVSQEEKSYFAMTKTSGFLSTKKITAKLEAEKHREFIGNDPGPCILYDTNILYSRSCDGNLSDLIKHMPSTNDIPTYTEPFDADPNSAEVRGMINVKGKNILLTRDIVYSLYELTPDFKLSNYVALPDLDIGTDYTLQNFNDGFVLYESGIKSVKYFSSFSKTYTTINIPTIPAKTLNAVELSSYKGSIGGLFNSATTDSNDDASDPDKSSTKKLFTGASSFVLFDNKSENNTYSFDTLYTSGGLCGDKKICLISNQTLDVYDIQNKKARKLFSTQHVQKVLPVGDSFVTIKDTGVLGFNGDFETGSLQYSFGDNEYCGATASNNGYVLCLINRKNDRFALYINPSQENNDSIDKKINILLQDPNVTTVSAYKNYLYISPNLGGEVYNPATQQYGYDPALVTSTNSKISELVQRAGIDRSIFTVINPYSR